MRIAILTQALHSNYGGLLQNFALQQVLRDMGHESITIDRHIDRKENVVKDVAKWLYQHIKPTYDAGYLTVFQKAYLSRLQTPFVDNNINKSNKITTQVAFNEYVKGASVDAYIVGSDQCWRPCYSANIKNYFLDFIDDVKIKKISYAASFGVDTWEYSDELTSVVGQLAQKFDAVSVRENSAVALCKEKLGVDAQWVVDPTMLLGAEGFMRFITKDDSQKFVLNYLLEESAEAKNLVATIVDKTGVCKVVDNLSSPIFKRFESLDAHTNIPVEQWLSNINNASFVVTDSFHGAVFSILFNKPFIVKLNAVRGNTRLESLLTDFDLMDCICKDVEHVSIPTFDWEKINAHLEERRKDSLEFLNKSLS